MSSVVAVLLRPYGPARGTESHDLPWCWSWETALAGSLFSKITEKFLDGRGDVRRQVTQQDITLREDASARRLRLLRRVVARTRAERGLATILTNLVQDAGHGLRHALELGVGLEELDARGLITDGLRCALPYLAIHAAWRAARASLPEAALQLRSSVEKGALDARSSHLID